MTDANDRFRCFGCGRFTDDVTDDGPSAEAAGQSHRWTTGVRIVRYEDGWRAAVACWWCFWQSGAGHTVTATQWDDLFPVIYADQLPPVAGELLSTDARNPSNYRWPIVDDPRATKIFRLRIDANAEGIVLADPAAALSLHHRLRDSTPIGDDWTPQRVVIDREKYPSGGRLIPVDLPASIPSPALNRRAVDGLRDLLAPCGELLPTICDGGEYFLFHVTAVRDILDEKRSRIDRTGGTILDINRHVFRKDAVLDREAVMFKVPCWSTVYVTDAFVERVRELGLTGLRVDVVGAIGPS